jgi:hypothetical protein
VTRPRFYRLCHTHTHCIHSRTSQTAMWCRAAPDQRACSPTNALHNNQPTDRPTSHPLSLSQRCPSVLSRRPVARPPSASADPSCRSRYKAGRTPPSERRRPPLACILLRPTDRGCIVQRASAAHCAHVYCTALQS